MSEPSVLRLKRKATDDAPSVLILERRLKKAATNIHYVLKSDKHEALSIRSELEQNESVDAVLKQQSGVEHSSRLQKRLYHLSRKRKATSPLDSVATFEEKRRRDIKQPGDIGLEAALESDVTSPQKPLKKPSKRAAVSDTYRLGQHNETAAERKQMEELSKYHQSEFLEEIETEKRADRAVKIATPSKRITPPKLSGQRSKEIHRQRVATNGSVSSNGDVHMEDEGDYVYDTYILAPASGLDAKQYDPLTGLANVGYLVINPEDESIWQTYLEDDPSDDEGAVNSDEFDENAEDFYGADYPEDELASDDEFNRNGYAYRGRGAFDEEYNEDTGAYSDDEDEYERMTNPFGHGGLPKQLAEAP